MTPDILIVGHIAKDITDGGWRPGGSVYYASMQAHRLDLHVAAVTACSVDVDPASLLPDVDWSVTRDDRTTTFENVYREGRRQQHVLAMARPLRLGDVPSEWRDAPIVLLAPLLHEIDASLVHAFAGRGGLLSSSIQGWLRALDGTRVVQRQPKPSNWAGSNVVFLSEEDLFDITLLTSTRPVGQIIVLTRGRGGCSVWDDAGRHDLPAFETNEVDPTGAGDVFSAAFLVRYHETASAIDAARFAEAAAALAVSGQGSDAIGDRTAIEARLADEKVAC